jgi:CBS domain containing-hemolysin-like protein
MTILVLVVLITIIVSANCSLYEAVLYSTRMGTLESVKTRERRPKIAQLFIQMKKNISEPLAAILILNTIANTAGATIAGMYAAREIGPAWLPVFSIVFTLAILFLSEIVPKTIGAIQWRTLWPFIVYPLKFMRISLYPAIYLTRKITDFLTRNQKMETITEDEILALIHLGAREGQISPEEGRMVRNIINLEERSVEEIMTPRTMIYSLPADMKAERALKETEGKGFSRIPVFDGDKENIIGYVLIQDITAKTVRQKGDTPLSGFIRPIASVAENTNCLTVLLRILKDRRHILVISDPFGGVAGIVTLEDVLETILGAEIVDETDRTIDLQEEARKRKSKRDQT